MVKMLEEGHHDVTLTEEDYHKLFAWIDLLNVRFQETIERDTHGMKVKWHFMIIMKVSARHNMLKKRKTSSIT